MKSVFIIAEAGVNHNGSVEKALELVEAAAHAGADAVKFQTFRAGSLVSRHARKAAYQELTTGNTENQLEMVRRLELPREAHRPLLEKCRALGLAFLSTPFDLDSARFLVQQLGLPSIKIPSGEITNGPFLLGVAKLGRPVILSTGMSTLGEVELALGILAFGYLAVKLPPTEAAFRDAFASREGQEKLRKMVSLLHCTTEYPAPFDQINLHAMDTLAAAFGLPVGLSDHTEGIAVPIAAAARGAAIIEKHFTLDRTLPGPDHKASLEPAELRAMVIGIRQAEAALGHPYKGPTPAELGNRDIARRSLVAARSVKAGEPWSDENLACKRPGCGIPAMRYWEMLGRPARRAYEDDELLTED